MTAQLAPALPPRWFVRAAWVLHRAAYRLTGGRFGTLRIRTIGRRSGKPHAVIVGYFEDGPNLVTLAMNGWADADPAWWLNLRAQPEATVDLADGHRTVRAREAAADERERLWAKFGEYRGWGDDLDALASQRAKQPAVVVLEPRT